MKNRYSKKRYKLNAGVQQITPDTVDYGDAYGIREKQNAKQEIGSNIAATAADMYMPGLGSGLKGVGAITDSLTKDAKGNYKNEFAESANYVLNPLATAGKFGSALTGDKTAAADLFSGMPATKLISKVFGLKNPFGKTTEEKVKEEAIKAEKAAALANAQKLYKSGSSTDAQSFLAKKGKYKLKSKAMGSEELMKDIRPIESEGREPVFGPKMKNGKRKLLFYNPDLPTHEEGGVPMLVVPKEKYNNGVSNLMPKRPASKYSLVGNGNMAYGAKQIKVNDLNNTALSSNLNGMPSANAANKFIQPTVGLSQVARQIPEARRKEKINTPRSHKKVNPDTNRIIDPPMLYEMKPPPPRSTFNTKNDFKKGSKKVKVYR
jgi:hypothetical protein